MQTLLPFLFVFTGVCCVVLATQFDDEWKESCREMISEMEGNKISSECDDELLKPYLEKLRETVDKINFICTASERKPNCKFDKGNCHFLYALDKAMRLSEQHQNDVGGRSKNRNSENANLADGAAAAKIFVQQLRADFNTMVAEIGLMEIGEHNLTKLSKEDAEELVGKLKDVQEDIVENTGFYEEVPSNISKSPGGFYYENAVTTALNEVGNLLKENANKWETNESDRKIQQILIQMIVNIKSIIYENELNEKTALLMNNDNRIGGKGIVAISGIFRQKFEQIRKLMGYDDKGNENSNLLTLKQLAEKTSKKAFELRFLKKKAEKELNALNEKANQALSKLQDEFVKLNEVKMNKFVTNVVKFRNDLRHEFLATVQCADEMPKSTADNVKCEIKNTFTKVLKQITGIEEMERMETEIGKAFRIPSSDVSIIEERENWPTPSAAEN